jgi:SRSO17 transposase
MQRIAAEIPGPHSGQSLQQFVNQSSWDPQAVRRRTAGLVHDTISPAAWIIEEVAFPKNGRYSAGVERQYARALGKVINCQIGLAAALTSPKLSVPVNWKLCLPESWDYDETRRARAHVPDTVRHESPWMHAIELVDDMSVEWGLPVATVVCDMSQCCTADAYLTAMDSRSLDYIVQVNSRHLVRMNPPCQRTRAAVPAGPGPGRVVPLVDVATMVQRVTRQTVIWEGGPDGRTLRSQFIVVQVRYVDGRDFEVHSGPRRLLMEWPLGKPHPKAYWLTNLMDWPIDDLVSLAKLTWRSSQSIGELTEGFGLDRYEGRSYLGWHHHVTLASAAYAFHVANAKR